MTGTTRQSRARSLSRKAPSGRPDLTERLRTLQTTLRRRLIRADALAEIFRDVNANLEPEPVGDALIAHLSQLIPVTAWIVLAVDEEARPRAVASRGLPSSLEAAAQGIGEWVINSATVFCSADASLDERLAAGPGAASAAIGFPLKCRGRIAGALVGIDRAPATREPKFSTATLDAVLQALEPGAIALDNAFRMQRAEALSVTDDLTQLYNSRYLSQVLHRETKRASRNGRPLSLLFLDLDGFKGINDTHGHLYGSSALVEAAGIIRLSARETDIVARFGGDEFALVLPDTGSEGAVAVAERIRDRIAAHRFLQTQGLAIKLTVSVGVATLPDVANAAEQLIHAADEAMYWVKEHGKNNVFVAGT